RLLQASDEARVSRAVEPGGRVDPGDPQAAEVALLETAADVAVLPGMPEHLDRLAKAVLATAELALDLLEDAVAAPTRLEPALYTSHVCLPFYTKPRRSAVWQEELDPLLDGRIDHIVLAEAAKALLALLLHHMVEPALAAANATRAGHLEPL